MVTKRKSEISKATGDLRRATARMWRALPMVGRANWGMMLQPWRLVPAPVALALIALIALAMVLDTGEQTSASAYTVPAGSPTPDTSIMIGGDTVAPGTQCEEDEVITYLALVGGTGVGCVNYEYVVMDFILECLIGNSDHGDNLASIHLRDPAYGSWCGTVVNDASDGTVSLADLMFDTAVDTAVTPTVTPTMGASATVTPTISPTIRPPQSLPSTGRG